MGGGIQHKVYQYVMMMETLLANDDVKLLMEKLTLNNQVGFSIPQSLKKS